MKKFLCTFHLPGTLNDEFWDIIPSHRNHVNELMRNEVIVTYSVNMERSRGWVVLNAKSEMKAADIINQFPIRKFIEFQLDELFIFDSMIGVPKLVMN
jgi:hypothetical protein